MQLIRCTQKLLKELRISPGELEQPGGVLGGWHANLLRTERRKCVLFTNDSTLFSIFVPGMKKEWFERMAHVFGQELFRSLTREGFGQSEIEAVLDEIQEIHYAKTNNRSVLGSMNDLAFQLGWIVHANGGLAQASMDSVAHELNRIPMSAIREHAFSVEALRSRLEPYAT
jgi:hypothetical protein